MGQCVAAKQAECGISLAHPVISNVCVFYLPDSCPLDPDTMASVLQCKSKVPDLSNIPVHRIWYTCPSYMFMRTYILISCIFVSTICRLYSAPPLWMVNNVCGPLSSITVLLRRTLRNALKLFLKKFWSKLKRSRSSQPMSLGAAVGGADRWMHLYGHQRRQKNIFECAKYKIVIL